MLISVFNTQIRFMIHVELALSRSQLKNTLKLPLVFVFSTCMFAFYLMLSKDEPSSQMLGHTLHSVPIPGDQKNKK